MKNIKKFNPKTDNKNWQILFDNQFANLQRKNAISRLWINGFSKLGIDNSKAPDTDYLNRVSNLYTGWKFIQTEFSVIIPPKEWYQMISRKVMPLNNFIRTPKELTYCDEPDKWHDIIGHIPFLMQKEYSDMYVSLANLYLKSKDNNEIKKYIDFLGAYIVELGLIEESGEIKALGATLYSSSGELEMSYTRENVEYFDKSKVFEARKYDRSSFQGKYYVVKSLKQITDLIDELALQLNK